VVAYIATDDGILSCLAAQCLNDESGMDWNGLIRAIEVQLSLVEGAKLIETLPEFIDPRFLINNLSQCSKSYPCIADQASIDIERSSDPRRISVNLNDMNTLRDKVRMTESTAGNNQQIRCLNHLSSMFGTDRTKNSKESDIGLIDCPFSSRRRCNGSLEFVCQCEQLIVRIAGTPASQNDWPLAISNQPCGGCHRLQVG